MSSGTNHKWQKLAEHVSELEFNENGIAVAEAGGKKMCVGRFEGKLFGFAYKCPHAGAMLSGGYINALGQVVCPLHRYKYDMATGRNVSGEGYYLKHWEVEEREDGVYVAMESGGIWNIFG